MKRLFKRAALAFAMGIMATAFALGPVAAYADEPTIAPYSLNDEVLDTYYYYACPKKVASHNMEYNKTYRLLVFQHGYKRTDRQVLGSWKAKNCACGSGTVTHYKNIYHTW